jgi:two-component system, NarL family, sensor kinase
MQVEAPSRKSIYCATIRGSMKKITPLLWLLICSIFMSTAYGQTAHYKDSLLQIIQQNKGDTNTLKAISSLYRLYFNQGNFRSSLQYCREALKLADELGLKDKKPRITYSIGLNFTNLIQYDSARHYLDQCVQLPGAGKDTILIVQCYNTRAMLSNYQSDFSMAITYLMKSVELLEAAKAPEIRVLMAQTYMNLCNNLLEEKQLDKGIEYGRKALQYKGYPDETRYRALIHLDLSDAHIKLNKAQEAGRHLDTAIQLSNTLYNPAIACLVANTQGAYYDYINDPNAALKAYRKAYQLCDTTSYTIMKASVAVNIAKISFQLGNHAEAEQFALTGQELARKSKRYKVVADAYDVLRYIAAQKGEYKKALQFAAFNKQYADSATNSATQQVTLSLESKYQHQKKEKEIAELKAGSAEKELLIVKRNRLLMIGGLSAAVLLLSIGWLYRSSKQKQTIAEKEQHLQQEQIKFLERQQQVVSLQSMLNGQETERTRIAKDLHDGLGGLFSTVKMNFSVLQHEHPDLKESTLFQKSYELVDTASGELRRIAHNMMPEVLMKLGLIQAVQDMCASISSGKLLRVTLQAYGMDKRLNASSEIMLYRILQELLNNIIKHAQATEAIIQFNKNGNRLTLTVEDNGKGFNTQDIDTARHSGMESVKNRVHYLNGHINIDSQKGVGTTVLMEFLINEEELPLS